MLRATLARGLSDWLGRVVRVGRPGVGQTWRLQPLLSACYVRDPSRAVRRFLRAGLRYTPRRRRLPVQFAAGTALTTRAGLLVSSRPLFAIEPGLLRARDIAVVPGNQRVRILDFGAGCSRVLAKQGFSRVGMRREIAVRGPGRSGPFPPITAADPDAGWFVEPIVDAVALARLPPWRSRLRAEERALERLAAWQRGRGRTRAAADWAGDERSAVRSALEAVEARFGVDLSGLERHIDDLLERAGSGTVELAPSHGDFQPGNLLVDGAGEVHLIDWERSEERMRRYDEWTLRLRSRAPPGLGQRLAKALQHGLPGVAQPVAELARFALQDLRFYLDESAVGPLRVPSAGLEGWRVALAEHPPSTWTSPS